MKAALFNYQFAALRGIQAGRPYYLAMCPMGLIPKIFLFDEEEVPPEFRAQRRLDRRRIPEMARYITDNATGYVFSALTASVDGDVEFKATMPDQPDIGRLSVPMNARFIINDGQHRRAAIEEALQDMPELRDETIGVVIFPDEGLKRSQQLFADLNKHATRPTASLGILYEHRDDLSGLSRHLVANVPVFKGLTEMERNSTSSTSRKLFTLSAIYQATGKLLRKAKRAGVTAEETDFAVRFWTRIGEHMPAWNAVRRNKLNAGELRRDYIQCHGLVLQALGQAVGALAERFPEDWDERLKPLEEIDWSRSNPTWEGRALIAGRLSKSRPNVVLTANVIKKALGLELTPEDLEIEQKLGRARNAA